MYNIPPTKALSFVNFEEFTTRLMAIFLIYLISHGQIMQYAWLTIIFTVNLSDVLIINEKNALNCALLILF